MSRRGFRPILIAAALILCAVSPFGQTADIPYDGATNLLKGFPADTYLGEVAGVATNSQGHVFVFTRAGSVAVGCSRSLMGLMRER